MDYLNKDCLLYLINIIKQHDEDKNLTLMHWSWTNNTYHNLIKPLIEIDEILVEISGYSCNCNDDQYGNYYSWGNQSTHPYWINYFRHRTTYHPYKIVKINNLMYKYHSAYLVGNRQVCYNFDIVRKIILNKIADKKGSLEDLLRIYEQFRSLEKELENIGSPYIIRNSVY